MSLLPSIADCCDQPCGDTYCAPSSLEELIAEVISSQLTWFIVTDATYGAKGDGSNDTAAIVAAYNAAVAAGGGILYFPRRGIYRFNLTINSDNIILVGCGIRDVEINTSYGWAPWDTSLPVIQVGNDTRDVHACGVRDTAIFGAFSGVGAGAIHLLGGCRNFRGSWVGMIGGSETLKFKAGNSFPCTTNSFEQIEVWEGTSSTVIADDTRSADPNSYCTNNKLVASYINGHNSLGYAFRVLKSNAIDFDGCYFDTAPDHGGYFFEGGQARFTNGNLDNGSDTLNNITIEWTVPNADLDSTRYASGSVRLTGSIKWIDNLGTTVIQLPAGGLNNFIPYGMYRAPYIIAPMILTTTVDPTRKEYTVDFTGSDGALTLAKTYGTDRFELSILHDTARMHLDDGDTDSYWQFDTPHIATKDANFRLWRDTNTSGNRLFTIFKGDGSADAVTQLNAGGDSYINAETGLVGIGTRNPRARLHVSDGAGAAGLSVFPNNAAAIGGGLTAGAFYRTGADPDVVCIVH